MHFRGLFLNHVINLNPLWTLWRFFRLPSTVSCGQISLLLSEGNTIINWLAAYFITLREGCCPCIIRSCIIYLIYEWPTNYVMIWFQVVSAFHIGRGGIAISFMGKGVTRNATLCLLHLAHEMKMRAPDKVGCFSQWGYRDQKSSWWDTNEFNSHLTLSLFIFNMRDNHSEFWPLGNNGLSEPMKMTLVSLLPPTLAAHCHS